MTIGQLMRELQALNLPPDTEIMHEIGRSCPPDVRNRVPVNEAVTGFRVFHRGIDHAPVLELFTWQGEVSR